MSGLSTSRRRYLSEFGKRRRETLIAAGQCVRCQSPSDGKTNCPACRSKAVGERQRRRGDARNAVLDHYGRVCRRCGEVTERLLTLDHIDNDGSSHRRSDPSARHLSLWLARNGFPAGFQVLCFNCNHLKQLETVRAGRSGSRGAAKARRYELRLKQEVIAAYGGRCSCCGIGELDLLTVDHVNGSGNSHRRNLGTGCGAKFYRWLKAEHLPAGYQVLCFSCNTGRALNGGVCPHHVPSSTSSKSSRT